MVPQGDFIVKDGFVCQQFALYADGRFVSSAWGEQSYDDQKMRFKSLATALEGAKSNGLMRCCKDIGIASELWDPHYIYQWKLQNVVEVWAMHRVTGKKQKLYRRKDRPPFDYPWQEEKVVEGAGASAEWLSSVDMDNTADTNVDDNDLLVDDISTPATPPVSQVQRQRTPPQQPQRPAASSNISTAKTGQAFSMEDDFMDQNDLELSVAPKKTQTATKRMEDEEDDLDSDGEPDMFADFNDEVEDIEPELDFEAPQRRQQQYEQPTEETASTTSSSSSPTSINLDETVHFGKFKGKTWGEIIQDKSFIGYAKWAESKMRPGEVRDKIVAAHQYAREMGHGE